MASNMELWNSWKSVPEEAKKKITGGRLNGMTDISPMWRFYVLTNQFGPIGEGWKFTVDKYWSEQVAEEVLCFVKVSIQYKMPDGEWSEKIEGFGGNKLLVKEKNGMHVNDEAYKMCLTDAIGTALKALGVGADVYWQQGYVYANNQAALSSQEIARQRLVEIKEIYKKLNIDADKFREIAGQLTGSGKIIGKSTKDMTDEEFTQMLNAVEEFVGGKDNG